MKRLFQKKEILTVPNLLSLLRLLLIPVILWLYVRHKNYGAAVLVMAVSGLTDVVDGFVARRFNMVSDLGKILDPIADKATQGAVILCLVQKYRLMGRLLWLFLLRELTMGIIGYVVLRKRDEVNSAKWYGKVSTVLLYTVMSVLLLFPKINGALANELIGLCMAFLVLAWALYLRFYCGLLRKEEITKGET